MSSFFLIALPASSFPQQYSTLVWKPARVHVALFAKWGGPTFAFHATLLVERSQTMKAAVYLIRFLHLGSTLQAPGFIHACRRRVPAQMLLYCGLQRIFLDFRELVPVHVVRRPLLFFTEYTRRVFRFLVCSNFGQVFGFLLIRFYSDARFPRKHTRIQGSVCLQTKAILASARTRRIRIKYALSNRALD